MSHRQQTTDKYELHYGQGLHGDHIWLYVMEGVKVAPYTGERISNY